MSETQIRRDYISGIRRGREIERRTQKSAIVLASSLGFAFGLMFGIILVTAIIVL